MLKGDIKHGEYRMSYCKGCRHNIPGMSCAFKDLGIGRIDQCPCIQCLVKVMCLDKRTCTERERVLFKKMYPDSHRTIVKSVTGGSKLNENY